MFLVTLEETYYFALTRAAMDRLVEHLSTSSRTDSVLGFLLATSQSVSEQDTEPRVAYCV